MTGEEWAAAFHAGRADMRTEAITAMRGLHPACAEPSVLIGSKCSCAIGIHHAITTVEGLQP